MSDLETEILSTDVTDNGVATKWRSRHTSEGVKIATAEISARGIRLYVGSPPEDRMSLGLGLGASIDLTAEQAIHLSRRLRALAGSIPA